MATDIPSRRRKPRENPSRNDATSGDFEDGTDFIRLDAESDSDDRHSSRTGKEREAPRERSRSHSPPSKRRRESEDNLEPRGHRRERDHENDNVREWDRGKRKYDMVFDFNEASHSKKRRTEPTERFTPWIDGVDWENCKSPAEMFHREVESFVKWISPSPQEDEIRGLVVEIISRFVTSQFPDAQVLPFGSFATKLYLPAGDIDLVIRSQSMAYSSTSNVLSSLASVIRRSGLTDGKVTIIAKAKVPIVKFVTSAEYGHFNVDISINQESGLESGRIINNFLRDFGGTSGACLALRALVLLTKLFLAQRQMNEVYTGGLGSYAIVCLCISFLQMHPKVRFGQIDPDNNLGVLVIEFFELYGHRFHYDEVGISLRNGGCYFGKRQRGWGSWGGNRRGSSLSIEDPGDPSNDISSGSYNFYNVRQNLAGAHDLLLTAVYTKAGILAARKSGTAKLLRDGYDARDMSILSAMLGVDQKTINNRLLVKEVYESQALHKLLGVNPKLPTTVPSSPTPAATTQPPSSPAPAVNGTDKEEKSPKKKRPRKKSKGNTVVVVVHDSGSGSQAQSRAASVSVHNAWAEAEGDRDELELKPVSDDDEGRYAPSSSSKKKRRKRHAEDEQVVVYTAASEEEEDHRRASSQKKAPRKGLGSRTSSGSSLDPAERRNYWLSKGIGLPEGSSSD